MMCNLVLDGFLNDSQKNLIIHSVGRLLLKRIYNKNMELLVGTLAVFRIS